MSSSAGKKWLTARVMTLNLNPGRLSSAALALIAPAAAEISSGVRGSRGWQPVHKTYSIAYLSPQDIPLCRLYVTMRPGMHALYLALRAHTPTIGILAYMYSVAKGIRQLAARKTLRRGGDDTRSRIGRLVRKRDNSHASLERQYVRIFLAPQRPQGALPVILGSMN